MSLDIERIRDFLRNWESRQLVAYVPCARRNFTGQAGGPAREDCGGVLGASGVTVGTGLDLGQQSAADLRRMGLGAFITRFSPYLGRRKEAAIAVLRLHPLRLSDEEVDAVDAAVHADYIRRAAALYNHAALLPLEECPPEAQTVVVSLFYQLGHPSRYPAGVWPALLDGDWRRAAELLRDRSLPYRQRRRAEAALLEMA